MLACRQQAAGTQDTTRHGAAHTCLLASSPVVCRTPWWLWLLLFVYGPENTPVPSSLNQQHLLTGVSHPISHTHLNDLACCSVLEVQAGARGQPVHYCLVGQPVEHFGQILHTSRPTAQQHTALGPAACMAYDPKALPRVIDGTTDRLDLEVEGQLLLLLLPVQAHRRAPTTLSTLCIIERPVRLQFHLWPAS